MIRNSLRDVPAVKFPRHIKHRPGEDEGENGGHYLGLNECPYPPAPGVIAAICKAAGTVNRYPDPVGQALAAAIAERSGHRQEHIVFGNGSEQLISLFSLLTLDAGDEAVMPVPSFPGYFAAARSLGAKPVLVPVNAAGANDAAALLGAVTDKTRILHCSPLNNPTGGMMPRAEMERLFQELPGNILLVVDDAYFEFARHAGAPDVLSLLAARAAPWVVLRTFSKAYALAGLRIGYGLCGSEEVTQSLYKVKSPFNVNRLAQVAALAALEDTAHVNMILEDCARQRQRLKDGFTTMGLATLPSAGNFISVRLPINGMDAAAALAEHQVFINVYRQEAYKNYIRISVGLSGDTDAMLEALRQVLAAASGKGQ